MQSLIIIIVHVQRRPCSGVQFIISGLCFIYIHRVGVLFIASVTMMNCIQIALEERNKRPLGSLCTRTLYLEGSWSGNHFEGMCIVCWPPLLYQRTLEFAHFTAKSYRNFNSVVSCTLGALISRHSIDQWNRQKLCLQHTSWYLECL